MKFVAKTRCPWRKRHTNHLHKTSSTKLWRSCISRKKSETCVALCRTASQCETSNSVETNGQCWVSPRYYWPQYESKRQGSDSLGVLQPRLFGGESIAELAQNRCKQDQMRTADDHFCIVTHQRENDHVLQVGDGYVTLKTDQLPHAWSREASAAEMRPPSGDPRESSQSQNATVLSSAKPQSHLQVFCICTIYSLLTFSLIRFRSRQAFQLSRLQTASNRKQLEHDRKLPSHLSRRRKKTIRVVF